MRSASTRSRPARSPCVPPCGRTSPWAHCTTAGVARQRLGKFALAEADFTRALERRPNWTEALLHRATVRQEQKNYTGAIADLTAALAHPGAPTRAYFLRSRIRKLNGRQGRCRGGRRRGTEAANRRT